ncbi:LysR family transcriptional regulator [Bordetella pertussis]|nr:LysR family transcriptional regulator [Bordetella pertussis]
MNLRQIEAFLAVVDLGTVTRAAETMYVTQSAVSRLISRLEREVGFTLFDRRQGLMAPTAEAKALHAEAMRSYIGLKEIQFAAQRIAQIGSGMLKVCVMSSLQQGALPRLVTEFMRKHPGISVMFDVQRHYDVVYAVSRGSAEIGFATLPVDHPNIESLPIARTPVVCLLPTGHPLAELEAIRPMDLHGVDFLSACRACVSTIALPAFSKRMGRGPARVSRRARCSRPWRWWRPGPGPGLCRRCLYVGGGARCAGRAPAVPSGSHRRGWGLVFEFPAAFHPGIQVPGALPGIPT